MFVNYAVWVSTEHFKKAVKSTEFKSNPEGYPDSTIASPQLFEKAVLGICVKDMIYQNYNDNALAWIVYLSIYLFQNHVVVFV